MNDTNETLNDNPELVKRQVTAIKRLAVGFGAATLGSAVAGIEVIRHDYDTAACFGGLALGGTALLIYAGVDLARNYAVNELSKEESD